MKQIVIVMIACMHFPFRGFTQGILSGHVFDAESGSPVAGAVVFIPELQSGRVTDSSGSFRFPSLPGGTYIVQASSVGYETGFAHVSSDGDVTHDFSLHPSQIELKEVKIIGTQRFSPDESPVHTDQISLKEMQENGSLSISDAVAKLPGVSQLTTGAGISKPVIRGMYGNRVLVNMMGLRFDNQQWQDEHGLGLSSMGIDRAEIVKGPSGLAYGSDAIGGVLDVIEEKSVPDGTHKHDISLRTYSNTRGLSGEYGFRRSGNGKSLRIRAGADSHADYCSAGNDRVLNSRFASYNLKVSAGKLKGNHYRQNHAYLSYSQFGFVFDTIRRFEADARLSRNFSGPHHSVLFGLLSTENIFYGAKAKYRINAGLITNLRQEQEGGKRISLNMLLNTLSANLQAMMPVKERAEWTSGVSLMGQSNTNYGSRTIVPDALTMECGVFTLLHYRLPSWSFQAGLRYDIRGIRTFETGNINPPGSEMQPFGRWFNAANGSLGFAWNPLENLNVKGNLSTGFRSGNLAELSSNGLHEGSARWEVGNPDLKTEKVISAETGFVYEAGEQAEIGVTAFLNKFSHYIYLAPDGTEYIGFFVYRFMQSDATLRGAELTLDVHPECLRRFDLHADASWLQARRADGSPLPFIPANRIRAELRCNLSRDPRTEKSFIKAGMNWVSDQSHPAQFETATPGYVLIHAAAGTAFPILKHPCTLLLSGTNLGNARYYDHLSRFKSYGIYNMGRNIILSLQYPF